MNRQELQRIQMLLYSGRTAMAQELIHTALAAPEQEPVAWVTRLGDYGHISWVKDQPDYPIKYTIPLFTHPAPSKPVPLTDEDARKIWLSVLSETQGPLPIEIFARAIEAVILEKMK